jgi:hypothetical protein
MSETVENPSSTITAHAAGAQPLANAKRERYAQARAICTPRMLAYREAGFESKDDHASRGNAAKLERSPQVRDRIAWLCREEEEVLRAKRRKIESWLWLAHDMDVADFYVDAKRVATDAEGNVLVDEKGEPRTYIVQDMRPFSELSADQRNVIQSLKYTEKGKPVLEVYSKMQANIELRKMLGIGAAARDEGDEFSRMTRDELAAFIARELRAIGSLMTADAAA